MACKPSQVQATPNRSSNLCAHAPRRQYLAATSRGLCVVFCAVLDGHARRGGRRHQTIRVVVCRERPGAVGALPPAARRGRVHQYVAAQHAALRISLSARRPSCKPSSILHHHPSLVMAAIAILSPSLMMGTTANERTGCIHNRRASHAAARTHAHDAVRLELRATSRRTLRAPNRAAVGGHHLSQLVVVRGAPATNTTTRSPRIELAFLFPPPPR